MALGDAEAIDLGVNGDLLLVEKAQRQAVNNDKINLTNNELNPAGDELATEKGR